MNKKKSLTDSKRMLRPHRKAGFTLVELLVVIAIIAVLVSILLPAIERANSMALQTACASNMRQIGIALHNYAQNFGGWFPRWDGGEWVTTIPNIHGGTASMNTSSLWDMNAPFPEATKRMGFFGGGGGMNYGFDTGFKPLYPDYIQDRMVFYCPGGRADMNQIPDFNDPYSQSTYCSNYQSAWGYGLRWGVIGTFLERDRTSNSGSRYIMAEQGSSDIVKGKTENFTGHLRGANFLFLDSSVQFIPCDKYKVLHRAGHGSAFIPQFISGTTKPSNNPAQMGIDQFYGKK